MTNFTVSAHSRRLSANVRFYPGLHVVLDGADEFEAVAEGVIAEEAAQTFEVVGPFDRSAALFDALGKFDRAIEFRLILRTTFLLELKLIQSLT